MDQRIGPQRHIAFIQLLDTVIHFLKLIIDPSSRKIIQIEMSLPFLDVIIQPPADRLDFRIPRIYGLVGMAVCTGSLQNFINFGRYGVEGMDILNGIGRIGREIFCGSDELDNDE